LNSSTLQIKGPVQLVSELVTVVNGSSLGKLMIKTFRIETAYLQGTEKSIQGLAFTPFIRNIASEAA